MSVVTNFIITIRDPDYDLSKEKFEKWDSTEDHWTGGGLIDRLQKAMEVSKPDGGWPRLFNAAEARHQLRMGPKSMEAAVWVGAGNFFRGDDMLEVIGTSDEFQKYLRVDVCEDDDREFTTIWPPHADELERIAKRRF